MSALPSSPPVASAARFIDYSSSKSIPVLMDLVRRLSSADEPTEVQRIFSRGVRALNPVDGYVSLSRRGLGPDEYKITRLALDADAVVNRFGDPWREFPSLPVHRGGFLGQLLVDDQPKLAHHVDLRGDAVLGDTLARFHSVLAMPLFDGGEALNWSITFRCDPEGFTLAELEESILRGNLVGGTVRNTVLAKKLRDANIQIREEMQRIAAIQRSLLPERMPSIPGVALAASYETFDEAGGDLYGFRPTQARRERADAPADSPWGLLIADASGHGPSAAVVSAMLHAIVHTIPGPLLDPADLLRHANDHLAAKRIEHSFVTAFAAIYDPRTRRLLYSRAGHEPPLVKNAGAGGATFRLEDAGDLPLGIMEDVAYRSAEIQLEPGQTLVLYTDGITEARDPTGRFFGTAGIEQSLIECTGEPTCVIGSITAALREHEAGRRPADDQTIVAMKVIG